MKSTNLIPMKIFQPDHSTHNLILALLVGGLLISPATLVWADEIPDIVINAKSQGGDDTFTFGGDLGEFEVVTEQGEGRHILSSPDAGQFEVTAHPPSGWDVLAIMCNSQEASIDFGTESVSFDLTSAGSSIPCTFVFRAR